MKSLVSTIVMVAVALTCCTKGGNTTLQASNANATSNQKSDKMKNLISIVEIPTADFSRAKKFYEQILEIKIDVVEMDGITMGLFPNSGEGTAVQLIHAESYKPSADGTIVYLNGGVDLKTVTDKIEAKGGTVVVPKTEISPDIGFYAIFIDTEGNKLGLHSLQ